MLVAGKLLTTLSFYDFQKDYSPVCKDIPLCVSSAT